MMTSFILMIRYSCWPLPALRCVMVASFRCVTRRASLQQTRRRLVDSVRERKILEGGLTFAASAASHGIGAFVTPQENDSTSISSLCLSSSGFAFDVPDLCKDV